MNRFESSAKPSSERERDLRRLSEFHTVLLGVAGHDLHQPVQVIQSTDEWLSSMLDADVGKVRQQLGEPAVARLSEQLDRLAGALRLNSPARRASLRRTNSVSVRVLAARIV